MGVFGIWQWVIILAIVLILFGGAGKISSIMGDFGKGLRNFKSGVRGDDEDVNDGADEMMEEIEAKPVKKTKKAKKSSRKTKAKR
jgi:sec-independent protein translocase protein TatA